MANKERPDEVRAKEIVEGRTGQSLKHWDKNGEADYISIDEKSLALEVTRLTGPERKVARASVQSSSGDDAISVDLQRCWSVFVPETQPGLKNIVVRMLPHLIELERRGVDKFFDQEAAIEVRFGGPNQDAYRGLLNLGISSASSIAHTAEGDHVHAVHLGLTSGGSSGGSDRALELIEEEVRSRPDNIKKLSLAQTKKNHLFVWLDFDTDFEVARPLQSPPPAFADRFGTPSRAPQVGEVVTDLWIVHEAGHGWHWDGAIWNALSFD